jgi:hypothetical protein
MSAGRSNRTNLEAEPVPLSSRIIGTGEMAALVRAYDWGSTPLGAIDTWSIELLTVVNLTLSSPSPARTMWGPDFILIYNDAYRPIPGPRHPEALGKSAHSWKRPMQPVRPSSTKSCSCPSRRATACRIFI